MTLTNRLTLFLALLLLVVLGGFSGTLYALARLYLGRQVEERLDTALDTLVAAVEIKPDCVEWEPAERRLSIGSSSPTEPLLWIVTDSQGKRVGHSNHLDTEELLEHAQRSLAQTGREGSLLHWDGQDWQVAQRRVRPTHQPPSATQLLELVDSEGTRYSELVVTVGVSREPARAALRQLALTLATVSTGIFVLSLLASRWVCRRGLSPVRTMASAARDMDSRDIAQRLPLASSGDELDDLAQSFNGLLDRLQQSFERQRRFTGDASHQLRTPLAAILGQIEVTQRRKRSNVEYQQTLHAVRAQADHLGRIVESLLFLARADDDSNLPAKERTELSTWLTKHLDSWKNHARYNDFRSHLGAELGYIDTHPVILGELLNILLDNACRYSSPGTTIHLRAERDNHSIHLDVTDHGRGIGPDDVPHIFAPFFRSLEGWNINRDGIGLGLSIALRLARSLGGSLSASSVPGEGSTFSVVLPLEEPMSTIHP